MKELILILSMFRAEAAQQGIIVPDSVTIEYAHLGIDTLGVATRNGISWELKISDEVEPELIESVVYHELGHVMGLDHGKGKSLMNYYYLVPINDSLKKKLFAQIRQLSASK